MSNLVNHPNNKAQYWFEHWDRGDPELAGIFNMLQADAMMSALEGAFDVRCTGGLRDFDSLENRVFGYEVTDASSPTPYWIVLKCYRPGRWSREALLDEHRLVALLQQEGLPVIAPLANREGATLWQTKGVHCAAYPLVEGRLLNAQHSITKDDLEQLGRTIAAMHELSVTLAMPNRPLLLPESFGLGNLEYLLESGKIPGTLQTTLREVFEELLELITPLFQGAELLPVHGDLHKGNILCTTQGLTLFDFDDSLLAPPAQDLMVLLKRDEQDRGLMEALLHGYRALRPFPDEWLELVEPLRALRLVWSRAWVASRWHDRRTHGAHPRFEHESYWQEGIESLRNSLSSIRLS